MNSTNTLGRYQIVREIARSNDIVYEAKDPTMGRRIALKELQMPPNLVGEQRKERVERFYREARAAGALTHPHIVTIYEVGEDRGRHFIAMEYLEGESLRDRLQKQGTLPLDEVTRIGAAVAEGLQFAHEHGVVHRDVKPDNIHMLTDGRVKITDFGIARITFEPTLTMDGQIFGTPSYMSPEQVTGKGIDARSDLFSLGVMLYEMVAGRKPFTGDSVITITYNIMNMDASPLAGISPALERVIRRAMAKDPGQRYRTAGEMAAELRAVPTRGVPAGRSALPPGRPALPPAAGSAPAPAPPRAMPPARPGAASPAGPAPGARPPLPRPAPAPLFPGQPQRPAMPPARPGVPPGQRVPMPVRPAMPPGGMPPGAMPPQGPGPMAMPYPQMPPGQYPPPYGAPVKPLVSPELRWFFGWIVVAVLVALVLIFVVWSVTSGLEARTQTAQQAASGGLGPLTQQAERATQSNDFYRAWQLYKQAVQKGEKPRERLAWNGAICAVNWANEQLQTNPMAAQQACQDALALAPNYGEAYRTMALIEARQEQIDTAIPLFERAIAAWRGRQSQPGLSEKDLAEAREMLKNAQESAAQVLMNDGNRLRYDGQTETARKRYQQAMSFAPQGSEIRQRLAQAILSVTQQSPRY